MWRQRRDARGDFRRSLHGGLQHRLCGDWIVHGDDKGGATKVLAAVCEADSAGADPRCGGTPGPFPGGGILTDATLPTKVGGGGYA